MHRIDAQIAIADAFDSGILKRQATSVEISDATGIGTKRIPRIQRSIGLHIVKNRTARREWIPSRFAPPRKHREFNFPNLGRPSPVTKAVVEVYESGQWSGPCYAYNLADRIPNANEESVVRALKRLKFKVVKRGHNKITGYDPPVYERPYKWPDVLMRQRELRQRGVSVGMVVSATDSAAAIPAIIHKAVQALDVSDIPLYKPGALKARIKAVLTEIYYEWDRDSISRRELAGWLKESPDAPLPALMARGERLMDFALRKKCPHCGSTGKERKDSFE